MTQFSDTTNKLGLIQACERYANTGDAGISGSATLLKEFTAHINKINKRIWHIIFMAANNWIYDDANQTDLPQATADLASGTSKYALPTTALTVKRVEIKDPNGLWITLDPITLEDINTNGGVDEFLKTDGIPEYYRLIGNTLELFAGPNCSSVGGLKIYFDRGSVEFASTDTTKTPGFASEYHDVLGVGASIEYLKIKDATSDTLKWLVKEFGNVDWRNSANDSGFLGDIRKFYQNRFKNRKTVLRRRKQSWS